MSDKETKLVETIFASALQYAQDVVNEEFDNEYMYADDTLGNILARLDAGSEAGSKLINILGDK